MKVSIKNFKVTMQLGSKGIEFDVYDNKTPSWRFMYRQSKDYMV